MSDPYKLRVGDKVRSLDFPEVIREITEVRSTGYTWKYPDIPDVDFLSENGTDPFFEWRWERV